MPLKRSKKTSKKPIKKEKSEEEKDKVIGKYIAKLEDALREKKQFSFWVFPNTPGFKKVTEVSFDMMQKVFKQDVEKYANTQICHFKISTRKAKDKYGTWISVTIWVITSDKDANIRGNKIKDNGCTFKWDSDDFKTTKFSFKLLEAMMHVVAENKHSCGSLLGFPITWVLNEMKKKKINLDDYLSPLSGI